MNILSQIVYLFWQPPVDTCAYSNVFRLSFTAGLFSIEIDTFMVERS